MKSFNIICVLLGKTLFDILPALSFSPGSILRIEKDLANLKIDGLLSVDNLYNEILGKFEGHATVRRRTTRFWSETWERFIPENLRLVIIFFKFFFFKEVSE